MTVWSSNLKYKSGYSISTKLTEIDHFKNTKFINFKISLYNQ